MERGWQTAVSRRSICLGRGGMLIQHCRFVGTEEGILEFNVNIQDRKTFPKIDVR